MKQFKMQVIDTDDDRKYPLATVTLRDERDLAVMLGSVFTALAAYADLEKIGFEHVDTSPLFRSGDPINVSALVRKLSRLAGEFSISGRLE